MTEKLWMVFELAVNLFQGALWGWFLCSTLKLKKSVKSNVIPFAVCALSFFAEVTVLNYVTFYEGAAIFLYGLTFFICAAVFFEGSIPQKIFTAIVWLNAMTVGSIFGINLIAAILQKSIKEFLPVSGTERLITVIVVNLITLLFLYVVKIISDKRKFPLGTFEWLFMSISLVLTIVLYMFLHYAAVSSVDLKTNIFIAFASFVMTAINIGMYLVLVEFSKKYTAQYETRMLRQHAEYQKHINSETKKQYENMQKTRHDFNNTIQIIDTLIHEGKYTEAEKYISNYRETELKSVRVVTCGNNYIDAVVNAKIAEASERGIEVQAVTASLGDDYQFDICGILGNLFDNAIRAAAESCNKLIILNIRTTQGKIQINVKNSIDASVLDTNPKLCSDKTGDGIHGYGTGIVRELAEKHNGAADFYEEHDFFCCNVVLYTDKK